MSYRSKKLGEMGEAEALNYLKRKNFKIVARNHRNKIGEIDIIAKTGKTWVFVEVKTKSSHDFGFPEEMVDARKKAKLIQVAELYRTKNSITDQPARIDVIAITNSGSPNANIIKHLENAVQID